MSKTTTSLPPPLHRPALRPPPPFPSNQTHLRQAPAPGPAGPLETQPLPDGGTLGSPASASRSIFVTDPASRRVSPSSPSRAPVTAFRASGEEGGEPFLMPSLCVALHRIACYIGIECIIILSFVSRQQGRWRPPKRSVIVQYPRKPSLFFSFFHASKV